MPEEKSPGGILAKLPARVRDSVRAAIAKRPWLVPVGIGAVVFTLLAVVPGYIATQPKFLERYTGFDARYASWTMSTHGEVPCQRCHVAPRLAAQLMFDIRMLGEFYASMVLPSRQPKLFTLPQNEACTTCHLDSRTVSPSGDLQIPHRAHVGVLKLKCVRCHAYLVHRTNPEGKHTPRMVACLTCHDGRTAKRECSDCHKKKSLPLNHRTAAWLVVHPQKQKELDCGKCHKWTKDWCAHCHLQRPASHAGRWRSQHRYKVEAHRNCEACHKGPFCIRCHGEVPKLNLDPALKFVE